MTHVMGGIGSFYAVPEKCHLPDKGRIYEHGVMALQAPTTPADTSTTSLRSASIRTSISNLAPGIGLAMTFAVGARILSGVGPVSSLTIAVVLGMVIGNLPVTIARFRPGLAYAGKHVLRFGVVALGMRLSLNQISGLGLPVIAVIVATVAATFFGTQALGRRLGVSGPLSLLIATGYSICGASAIAAMEATSDADEEEVALAIGLVTLAGTIAMFGLPQLATLFDLTDSQFAIWAGASIHDVAQVVAAGSTRGSAVLAGAVVVKLTRVLLLAPLVTGVSIQRSRKHTADNSPRPAPMPAFVVGFLLFVAIRSSGAVPDQIIETTATIEKALFAIALVGLGAGVRIDKLRTLGGAPVLLGGLASGIVATVSLAAVLLTV